MTNFKSHWSENTQSKNGRTQFECHTYQSSLQEQALLQTPSGSGRTGRRWEEWQWAETRCRTVGSEHGCSWDQPPGTRQHLLPQPREGAHRNLTENIIRDHQTARSQILSSEDFKSKLKLHFKSFQSLSKQKLNSVNFRNDSIKCINIEDWPLILYFKVFPFLRGIPSTSCRVER